MKICILAPSEAYLKQAGVRIRYRRIEAPLATLGHELSVVPIERFTRRRHFTHDAYIVSKCYDARSLAAAEILSSQGQLVGVDLFDDYFSQVADSRFTRLRLWLNMLLAASDFVLCSTPSMQRLARQLAPEHPVHVVNDPFGQFDPTALREKVQRKLELMHETGILHVAWFGIGDNPDFPVGLTDLVAYGGQLSKLRASGFDVQLDILTNRRAMGTRSLKMLRRLPVPYTLTEWSEEREAELLDHCPVCFLPVNAQSFSVVKSLNRAVTALTAGTQVLSAGFPLYESLSPFVYRSPKQLVVDLKDRRPRLRQETLSSFEHLMSSHASPSAEASKLATFLEGVSRSPATRSSSHSSLAIIHGHESSGEIHKFIKRMDGISIATPFTRQKLNFDIRFIWRKVGSGMEMLISKEKRSLLAPEVADHLVFYGMVVDTEYYLLDLRHVPEVSAWDTSLGRLPNPAGISTVYADVMSVVRRALEFLLPHTAYVLAENSKLPISVPFEKEVA